jgi:hypothetical protein
MLPAALALFFTTGFAALVYQVVWQRTLTIFSGADVHSATVVVAAFMAGLGCGSLVGGHLADRLSQNVIPRRRPDSGAGSRALPAGSDTRPPAAERGCADRPRIGGHTLRDGRPARSRAHYLDRNHRAAARDAQDARRPAAAAGTRAAPQRFPSEDEFSLAPGS